MLEKIKIYTNIKIYIKYIFLHFSTNDNLTLILQQVSWVTRYLNIYGISISFTDSSSPQSLHFCFFSVIPVGFIDNSNTGPNNVPHFWQTKA